MLELAVEVKPVVPVRGELGARVVGRDGQPSYLGVDSASGEDVDRDGRLPSALVGGGEGRGLEGAREIDRRAVVGGPSERVDALEFDAQARVV
jgi:hypothetical protein